MGGGARHNRNGNGPPISEFDGSNTGRSKTRFFLLSGYVADVRPRTSSNYFRKVYHLADITGVRCYLF